MPITATLKETIKATPLWLLMRPRRIHVYGIGAPKTGTRSIARLFSGHYRSAHEAYVGETIDIARAAIKGTATRSELQERLKARDRRGRFECESNALLAYVAEELANLFPEARFICTVRSPRSWMRSAIDQHINVSAADRSSSQARTLRPRLYNVLPSSDFPPEEQVLAEHDEVWNLDAYLRWYVHHYNGVLDAAPEDCLLFVRTHDISDAAERVADFVGIPVSTLSVKRGHANKTIQQNGLLDALDERYVSQKIETHCSDLIPRIERKLGGCL